jgi:hypothetical protein
MTQTLQGALQQAIRNATGKTTQDFNGDLHDLCGLYGIPQAPISGRIIPLAQIFDSTISSSSAALNYLLQNSQTVVGPIALFSNGEQGAWYDPSDFSTLFTDSAGTTPVTGVEQFVGLMLDKSKGLVLGSELVDTMNTAAAWTGYGTNTVVNEDGGIKVTYVDNVSGAYTFFSAASGLAQNLTVGAQYAVTGEAKVNAGSSVNIQVNATGTTVYKTVTSTTYEQFSFRFIASDPTSNLLATTGMGAGEVIWLRNFSVKQVAGNHATQTTSAKRPKLAARYNLLTYTEQFDNGVWAEFNGLYAGSKFTPDVSNAEHRISFGLSTTASTYTHQYRVKAAGYNWCFIGYANSVGSRENAFFDLQNGATGTIPVGATAKIVSVGGGVYDIFLTTATGTFGSNYTLLGVSNANNVTSFAANGVDGIEIFRADLRPASQATGLIGPTYQRVVDAATYDTAGFLPYLEFNGLSWSMSTNSIDFSAGDKMTVWAGVRKLSDANTGTVAQLSPSTSTNNGVFGLYVPFNTGASADYAWQSKGTLRITVNSSVSTGPATSVFTAIGNISAPLAQLRQNAAQIATSSASQGTGNFGNFALNIGEGAGFLNGWLTSLIVRGAQSTQSQIEATESWVNGKTGAY